MMSMSNGGGIAEYRRSFSVGLSDVGVGGFCRKSALLSAMQDTASRHTELMGIGRGRLLRENGAFWALVQLYLRLYTLLYLNDEYSIVTRHEDVKGVQWYRAYELYRGDEPVGSAATTWVLMSFDTRKLLRGSSAYGLEAFMYPYTGESRLTRFTDPEAF